MIIVLGIVTGVCCYKAPSTDDALTPLELEDEWDKLHGSMRDLLRSTLAHTIRVEQKLEWKDASQHAKRMTGRRVEQVTDALANSLVPEYCTTILAHLRTQCENLLAGNGNHYTPTQLKDIFVAEGSALVARGGDSTVPNVESLEACKSAIKDFKSACLKSLKDSSAG